jgi:hypothetical protein
MSNLEKLEGLKKELNRLNGIFNELNIKDEKVMDSIIEQMNLVEEEVNLLMKKAKVEEKLGRVDDEIEEDIGLLKGFYEELLNRIKSRQDKNDVTKSIFEDDGSDDIVEQIIREHEAEKKQDTKQKKDRIAPIFVNGEIIE